MFHQRARRVLQRVIEKPQILSGRLKGIHWNHLFYCLSAQDLIKGNFRTVIDIGAHEGEFINAARWAFPHAKIYAFEPIKEYYEKIKNIGKVEAHNFGLWDRNGKSTIYFNKEHTGSSSFLRPTEEYDKYIEGKGNIVKRVASFRRFDTLSIPIQRPCFAKLDVEGAEFKALLGFGKRLSEIDVLQIECFFRDFHKNQTRLSGIFSLLEKYGFSGFVQKEVNYHDGMPSVCDLIFFKKFKK